MDLTGGILLGMTLFAGLLGVTYLAGRNAGVQRGRELAENEALRHDAQQWRQLQMDHELGLVRPAKAWEDTHPPVMGDLSDDPLMTDDAPFHRPGGWTYGDERRLWKERRETRR
jgi:hypothetical protein